MVVDLFKIDMNLCVIMEIYYSNVFFVFNLELTLI